MTTPRTLLPRPAALPGIALASLAAAAMLWGALAHGGDGGKAGAGPAATDPTAARMALPSEQARRSRTLPEASFDGVVEAVRQTVLAAQVSGAVVQLDVKVGDPVKAGQVLLRLDPRAAEQAASASAAQVQAAKAQLAVAAADYERQKQLARQAYISQAALERAESDFKATQAQLNAQIAQAGAARTQTDFTVVRAPYAGIVADVPVVLGDMAMPGRALVTVYDPSALRVTANLPQTQAARLTAGALPRIEFADKTGDAQWVQPLRAQLLPTVDATTHTVQLRADLPPGFAGQAPGAFARVWLPQGGADAAAASGASLTVPLRAVLRRAELTGLYVLGPDGQPQLRQVRLGRTLGERVEVLAGVSEGERVVTDPQAAARAR